MYKLINFIFALYYTEEMTPTELTYITVCDIIMVTSQFLPSSLLFLLDNIVVRILAVCLLIYVIRAGPTASIIVFMTVAVLFLERNRRKVGEALKKLDAMEVPKHADVSVAYEKTAPVDVPSFSIPESVESDFLPHDTHISDVFEPVDVSINQKAVLTTIYPLNELADELYEKMGFGHIEGVHTME